MVFTERVLSRLVYNTFMGFFKKKLSEKDLVMGFLKTYAENVDSATEFIKASFKENQYINEQHKDYVLSEVYVWIWFLACQMLPIRNLFDEPLKTRLYRGTIGGASSLLELDESFLDNEVQSFINDFNENYGSRSTCRFAYWIEVKVFGTAIPDSILNISIDLFASRSIFNWGMLKDSYKIVW